MCACYPINLTSLYPASTVCLLPYQLPLPCTLPLCACYHTNYPLFVPCHCVPAIIATTSSVPYNCVPAILLTTPYLYLLLFREHLTAIMEVLYRFLNSCFKPFSPTLAHRNHMQMDAVLPLSQSSAIHLLRLRSTGGIIPATATKESIMACGKFKSLFVTCNVCTFLPRLFVVIFGASSS